MEAESEAQSNSASKLWRKAYEELRDIDRLFFSKTLDLVQEAVMCHESKCYAASAVMCRGALESMLHTLKAWRKQGDRYYLVWEGRKRLGSLIRWARGNGVMSETEAKMADDIRQMGDLSAHIAQRIDEERYKHAPPKSYRLWVGEEESGKLLENTVELLIALTKKRHTKLTRSSST